MRDLHNNLDFAVALAPLAAAVANDTAQVGAIIDRQGHVGALEFVIATGTLADVDATFTVLVEHGDAANLSDAAAVPDADLLGTEASASFTFAEDSKCRKIGYRGIKRYVRLTITPANNTGAAPLAAIAIWSPERVPSAAQPA